MLKRLDIISDCCWRIERSRLTASPKASEGDPLAALEELETAALNWGEYSEPLMPEIGSIHFEDRRAARVVASPYQGV